ncbi:lipopolysaccharide biosynthesis protein [Formosa sp. Hel1_33_131]|uniref:O-antigen translocase n=1 Tax=Formosa sp. Hel1_33_131 TaxID=1336794 RepID=UPI00084E35E7|nr:O-antigen translocase [Formosa sp. Hel1_33_131]AOR27703.1 lipopolysaccharide biosynthesis protein [Formosa sp. Hel1_33_131]
MNFVNSSLFTGISTLIRVISNIVITKVIAISLGPSGMVLLGQINNLVSFVRTLSTGGVQQGIVKLVAESENNNQQMPINASVQISLFSSFTCGLFLIVFREQLGMYIFFTLDYNYLFFIIAAAIIPYAINIIFVSVLNGMRQLKLFVVANIISNILGLIISLLFIYFFKVEGLLIAFSINQSIAIISTLYLIRNQNWWKSIFRLVIIDKIYFKKLFSYSVMALVSASTVPVAYIIIRTLVITEIGEVQAGHWEALIRVSSVLVMVMATSYSTYLLPTLSSIKKEDLRKELYKIYKIVIPIAIIFPLLIFILKDYVVLFLYSEEFIKVVSLFKYQLIGDGFRIISYVTGFLILAKSHVKLYVMNELIQFILYVGLSTILIKKIGLEGVTLAYMLTAMTCLLFQLIVFRKILWVKN